MISVNQLTKTYDTIVRKGWFRRATVTKTAVQNLTLELHPGEIVGLLGLNGAGKTTTIKMLSTLLEPTSGSIQVDGLDIVRDRRQIQGRINMIAGGERMLYWRLTGRENLEYFGRLYGIAEGPLRVRIEELLAEVGLKEAADQPVEQYSKGMKQRLQIARGLMNDPKYLFLDEPTLGLDAPIARHLRSIVKKLAVHSGKGILLTSHYLQEVEELCDRVCILDRGQLIIQDTPQAIARMAEADEQIHIQTDRLPDSLAIAIKHRYSGGNDQSVSIAKEETDDVISIRIRTRSSDELMPELLQQFVHANIRIRSVEIVRPTLEDAIIALSQRNEGLREALIG